MPPEIGLLELFLQPYHQQWGCCFSLRRYFAEIWRDPVLSCTLLSALQVEKQWERFSLNFPKCWIGSLVTLGKFNMSVVALIFSMAGNWSIPFSVWHLDAKPTYSLCYSNKCIHPQAAHVGFRGSWATEFFVVIQVAFRYLNTRVTSEHVKFNEKIIYERKPTK